MRKLLMLAALAGIAAVALTATTAGARPPGLNGQIAFARYNAALGDTQVYVVNPDGSGERFVQGPTETGECPEWSPDSTLISTCGGSQGSACSSMVINPDDVTSRCVPNNPATAYLFLPCGFWSTDGTRMYCEGFGDGSLNGIYSVRASDGGDLRRVTSTPGGDDSPGDASPNSDKLVFNRGTLDALFVVNSDGSGLKQITPTGLLVAGSAGNWSPQGNEILFSAQASPDVAGSFWVVHSDGSGLHQIPIPACGKPFSDPNWNYCLEPAWSPDGKKIVFNIVGVPGGFQWNVYTVNADGSGLFQVTHDTNVPGEGDESPDWGTHPLAH